MKKVIIVLCVLLAVLILLSVICFIYIPSISGSGKNDTKRNRLEKIAQNQKSIVIADYSDFQNEFNDIANRTLSSADGESLYLYLDNMYSNLPVEIQQDIAILASDCSMELDCVYTTGSTDYIYPTEACVFRTTVMDRNEVYCWIDLVYSEYWDPYLETDSGKNMLDNEIITRLSPNWCIVKLYGY